MKTRFLPILLTLALCLSLLPGTALAEGTTGSISTIDSVATLETFRDEVNSGISYSGQTVTLTADLDLKNEAWTPIGKDLYHDFKGTFNGNGKTISGLKIDVGNSNIPEGATMIYYGLFGCTGSDGTVKNLAVSGSVSVNVTTQVQIRVGGIVGSTNGSIQNCRFSGSVSGSSDTENYVGGVAGYVGNSVSNSYNTGSVSGSGAVGGVAGFVQSSVSNSYNTGSVSGSVYVGGVVGWVNRNVSNSYNTGSVISTGSDSKVGGVAGYMYGNNSSISNCFYLTDTAGTGVGDKEDSTGQVESKSAEDFANQSTFTNWEFTENTGPWVMGPFRPLLSWEGTHGSENKPYQVATVSDLETLATKVNAGTSYNGNHFQLTADLDLNNEEWTPIGTYEKPFKGIFNGNNKTISGLNVTGSTEGYYGLFGYSTGTVKNLAVSGNVSVNTTERVCVGGIVGASYGTIQNCRFSGSVSGGSSSRSSFGGVAGDTNEIENCYNTATVSGSGGVGGVAGYVAGSGGTNCYSTGSVSGSGYVGGVAGYADGRGVSNCFYLENTAGQGVGGGGRQDGTTAITAAQFAEEATFNNNTSEWDFNNTWVIGPFRPLLKAHPEDTGSGTAGDPYKISLASDLNLVRGLVNEGTVVPNTSTTYSAQHYQLTTDLDLSGIENWIPIGTETNPFKGTFEGNGHTISSLTITDSTGVTNYGLFGYSTGTVQNLAVSGKVSVTSDTVGGILGCNAGTLKSCYYVSMVSSGNSAVSRAIGTATESGTASNCFYLDDTGTGTEPISGVEAASTTQFESGEITWKLQNTQIPQIWGQTIPTDDFPVPTRDTNKKVYQVKFDPSNNTGDYQYTYTNPGGTVSAPTPAPTQIGSIFDGWFESETATDAFAFDTTPINKNLTLTARWTLHENHDYVNGTCQDCGIQHEDHTYENGVCSVCGAADPTPPSPGGGGGSSKPSTPTVTVPVSSEASSVSVKATVKNGTASVEISDKQINQVAAEGAEQVTVDLTGLKNVESATLPAHVVETTSNAEDVGLTVALPTGTVSLDSTALNSLPADQDVTVSVKQVPATDLNDKQQAAVGDMANIGLVFDVEILVGDEQHTDLNGGTVTISIPYTPKKGENPSKMTVWYIRDDGMIMPMGGYYDEDSGCFVFEAKELPLRVS